MSYKNDIKNKIDLLQEDKKEFIEELDTLVRVEYLRALEEMKITGQSLQSITYEFLEALEEALHSQQESALESTTHIMLDTLYSNANDNIQKSHLLSSLVEQEFYETVELEKAQLVELVETFKAYAEEKNLHSLKNDLQLKEDLVLQWLKNIQNQYQQKRKEVSMGNNCF